LAGLITEEARSRKGVPVTNIALRFDAEKTIRKLRLKEVKHNIASPIREIDFSMAAPVFAWANGCDLKQLAGFGVPEGDLIRILRMTIQLLRTLRDRIPDPEISDRMDKALDLINRDVVDAQAQLEVG
ncbi:MAG: hypothetical protein LBC70_10070, partial [Chitinispirillales bacterium]|nr:hypothetical protein [Chitinispirillales bacterium]